MLRLDPLELIMFEKRKFEDLTEWPWHRSRQQCVQIRSCFNQNYIVFCPLSLLSPFSRRRRYHHFAAIFSSEEDDLEFVQIRYLVLARRWIQEVALSVRKE